MDRAEELLRRLALNDESRSGWCWRAERPRSGTGARAQGRPARAARRAGRGRCGDGLAAADRQLALAAGATEAEIVGVLVAVAPTVGLARVVATAPKLATAIGYEDVNDE